MGKRVKWSLSGLFYSFCALIFGKSMSKFDDESVTCCTTAENIVCNRRRNVAYTRRRRNRSKSRMRTRRWKSPLFVYSVLYISNNFIHTCTLCVWRFGINCNMLFLFSSASGSFIRKKLWEGSTTTRHTRKQFR